MYTDRGEVLPDNIQSAISQYVISGLINSNWLRGVLENNLKSAIFNADCENIKHLRITVTYLSNCVPHICWGSPDRVTAWVDQRSQVVHTKF